MPGKFITIEGIDGTGKSEVTGTVVTTIENAGFEVITTREVGGTAIGEAIRELVLSPDSEICSDAEILLMFAARAQHLKQVILPNLEAGRWVVCDRFTDSTYAYQGGGRGVSFSRISIIEDWTQGQIRPDLTLLFDVDVEIAQQRVRQENYPDRFENEAYDFHARVQSAFSNIQQADPTRVKLIDTTQTVKDVRRICQKVIQAFIGQVNDVPS